LFEEKKWKLYARKKHTCVCGQTEIDQNSRSSIKLEDNPFLTKSQAKEIERQLSEEIYQDPFRHSSYFLNKTYIISQAKIRKLITEIKKEMFPKEFEIVFNG